jgi:hypothetical protein
MGDNTRVAAPRGNPIDAGTPKGTHHGDHAAALRAVHIFAVPPFLITPSP